MDNRFNERNGKMKKDRDQKWYDLAKLCPFCGGKKFSFVNCVKETGYMIFYCCKCGTAGPHGRTKKIAIELWNKRV